jgi:protein-S-isoprenylcysteine O-methyltransferase Ste14
LALTAAGLGIAVWARLYIGSNWSGSVTLKVGHQLMKSGPYRFVRHPIYSGLLLAIAGTALTNLRVRSVIGLVCLWVSFQIKSRIEERLMQQTFGPEYTAYKQETGALLPKF